MRRSFCFSRSCSPYSDKRCLRSLFTPPGGTSSLHFDSSGFVPLFRNRSVPSRRESLHFGPVYFAMANLDLIYWSESSLEGRLDAPLLGRATTVMGDRRDVFNVGDLQTAAVQRTHRRFASRSGTHHAHLDILHPVLLRRRTGALGRHLRGERGRLARAAEAAAARGRPGQRVALTVGDGDDGIVERGVHVRDRVQDVLARLLAGGLCGAAAGLVLRVTLLLISHIFAFLVRRELPASRAMS